ncbi:hypothetical protein EXIGLDRAFT_773133 [Exidia glandulosa HHB12029]|uniref:Uncharacterized protein n=1 Tax=Exidia glandulosa HHB12029 TaxID=1314781 RepID=A0A165EYU2_EXIGL|nr:hypothetical protein EXIGLDRAFT_773133 [Exidia glandulosa HHB12029]
MTATPPQCQLKSSAAQRAHSEEAIERGALRCYSFAELDGPPVPDLEMPKTEDKPEPPSSYTRSLRSLEILPAEPEDTTNAKDILPAESTPAVPPQSPPLASSRRSSMLATSVPPFLAAQGLNERSRDEVVDRLVLLLYESQRREKHLAEQLRAVEAQYARANAALTQAKGDVAKIEQDLPPPVLAAGSFTMKKETGFKDHRVLTLQVGGGEAALLSSFDDINKTISALAVRILDGLDKHDAGARLDHEALWRLEHRNKPAHILLQHFLACGVSAGVTLAEVAEPIAQSLFCGILSDVVFMPFAPGCSSESHDHMSKLYAHVCLREPQEYCARWRALTYNSLRPPENSDHELIDFIVKTFFSALHDVFASIARQSRILQSPNVFIDYRAEATGIAMQTLRWRDLSATSYLKKDYTAFYVWPLVRVDADDFQIALPPAALASHSTSAVTEVVVMTTALGLSAMTSVPQAGGAYTRREVTIRPAQGFAADFAKLAQLDRDRGSWASSWNRRGRSSAWK